MTRTVYYTATTLDGFIAIEDHSADGVLAHGSGVLTGRGFGWSPRTAERRAMIAQSAGDRTAHGLDARFHLVHVGEPDVDDHRCGLVGQPPGVWRRVAAVLLLRRRQP